MQASSHRRASLPRPLLYYQCATAAQQLHMGELQEVGGSAAACRIIQTPVHRPLHRSTKRSWSPSSPNCVHAWMTIRNPSELTSTLALAFDYRRHLLSLLCLFYLHLARPVCRSASPPVSSCLFAVPVSAPGQSCLCSAPLHPGSHLPSLFPLESCLGAATIRSLLSSLSLCTSPTCRYPVALRPGPTSSCHIDHACHLPGTTALAAPTRPHRCLHMPHTSPQAHPIALLSSHTRPVAAAKEELTL